MNDNSTRAHYDAFLSPIYRWMLGDFAAALDRSRKELESLGIGRAGEGASGLDLGAGNGLQTIPLIDAGYSMTAVDSSRELLAELVAERPSATVVVADLLDADAFTGSYDLVVCMGDTLTHLGSQEDVDRLLTGASRKLAPGGTIALTFRDYVSSVRRSAERFILVRSDADRILTCCLDYGADRVEVTDIVHERRDGAWELRASSYRKLRLSRDWVVDRLAAHGLAVTRAGSSSGRIVIVARRPS